MKKLPKPLSDTLYKAFQDNNAALIVELMKRHGEKYHDSWYLWFCAGTALGNLFRFDEAQSAFDKAVALIDEENVSTIYAAIANLYRAQGNYEEAARWYKKITLVSPSETLGTIHLAGCYARRGDLEKAEEIYRHATTLEGDPEEAWLNLGGVLLSQERYEEAQSCFIRALEIDADYEDAKICLQDVEEVLELLET